MGSGALCISCNLHKDSPAPQARKSMQAQPARIRGVRRILMGGDMLCLGCNWHEKNPAPQARRACGFNPPALTCGVRGILWEAVRSIGRRLLWEAVRLVWAVTGMRANQFAFMRAYRIRGVRRILMGGDMLCLGCILRKENPAPQARIACRLSLPRHMAAGDSYGKSVRPIMSGGSYGKWYALCKL